MRCFLRLPIVILLVCVFAPLSEAATKFTPQDRTDIQRIEAYLNNFKSLRSDFVQVSSDQYSEGVLYIERPNKLRLKYTTPSHIQVYSSGFWLTYVDTELEAIWHVPIKSTAASLFVRENITLSGDIFLQRVKREPGVISVVLRQTENQNSGSLELIFTDNPLTLRKWNIIDGDGISTSVTLLSAEFDITIPGSTFTYEETEYEYQSE
ncbi:MAG: outer membrane lipoprotein carrier protein LolA [Pseudomonadota bacterium]|nr:outer membrane lipoprotein carrier protein LolA [Pseudomonadota bacterium]